MSRRFHHQRVDFSVASAFVAEHHRHHTPPVGHLFSLGAYEGERLCGVAIVGRPVARARQDGLTAEVTRLCTDGTKDACSFLLGCCARAALVLGFRRIGTYTLAAEGGGVFARRRLARGRRGQGPFLEHAVADPHRQAPHQRQAAVGGRVLSVQILIGDCRKILASLPDGSVNTCVSSPPYYGLRDYKTGAWVGGDPDCDHRSPTMRKDRQEGHAKLAGSAATNAAQLLLSHRSACGKCGAAKIDQQIGLEKTPEAFVAQLVEVYREVRRVLRDDGTVWINIGDSYASRPNGSVGKQSRLQGALTSHDQFRAAHALRSPGLPSGLKHKDLIGIPWMLAFALRADGWYLRQEIIWSKPNAMPESVKDRCTKAHETIFLLSKSERYYFDADSILEEVTGNTHARVAQNVASQTGSLRAHGGQSTKPMKAVVRAPKTSANAAGSRNNESFNNAIAGRVVEKRNKRSVWTIPTASFKDAHFATYPPELIRDCILAGAPLGGVVLDPFGGAGTTGLVAERLGRNCILVELNPAYAAMAQRRLKADLACVSGADEAIGLDPLPLFKGEAA